MLVEPSLIEKGGITKNDFCTSVRRFSMMVDMPYFHLLLNTFKDDIMIQKACLPNVWPLCIHHIM